MVVLWKLWCALCGSLPEGGTKKYPDLRRDPQLYEVAKVFQKLDSKACPCCTECVSILRQILEFSQKCAQIKDLVEICSERKLYKNEDILKAREELLKTEPKAKFIFSRELQPLFDEGESSPRRQRKSRAKEEVPSSSEAEDDREEEEELISEMIPETVEPEESLIVEEEELLVEVIPKDEESDSDQFDANQSEDEDFKPAILKRDGPKKKRGRPRKHQIVEHFDCPNCDLKLPSKRALQQHRKTHSEPLKCGDCGKEFKFISNFREHAAVHRTEKPHKCKVCGTAFKLVSTLTVHMQTHSETKRICEICGKQLQTNHTYHTHLRTHSDVSNYKCHICPKEFKKYQALKEHLFGHCNLRPYTCPFCFKDFINSSSCRLHKVRCHPVELAEFEAAGKTVELNLPSLKEVQKIASEMFGKPLPETDNDNSRGKGNSVLVEEEDEEMHS